MDQIKALNDAVGKAIVEVIPPTIKIFTPLLLRNRDQIFSIPVVEESYGTHPCQKLDIYLAPLRTAASPTLIFFYGGGLVRGDKRLENIPEGLVYHNFGSFFASRGITTVVADYRKVNSPFGGDDAVFPSGGEDFSLVLKWHETFREKGDGNVFLMGNSAGGIHLSTFLLAPQFLEQRKELAKGEKGVTLKGAVALAVPFHFRSGLGIQTEVSNTYYGGPEDAKIKCPYGLLEAIEKIGKSREETFVPRFLLLLGEYDPKDEIGDSMHDFSELGTKIWSGVELRDVKGHNHFSPIVAVGSGDVDGERWGEDVKDWIKRLNK